MYGSSMIGNHGYQIILGNVLKNPLLKINLTEAYVAMKEEVCQVVRPVNAVIYCTGSIG